MLRHCILALLLMSHQLCSFLNHIISIGGLRPAETRDKLAFSRKFNNVVLGFGPGKENVPPNAQPIALPSQKIPTSPAAMGSTLSKDSQDHTQFQLDFAYMAERLGIQDIRPLQRDALRLLFKAQQRDTKVIQAPTSMGKDLLPFALAVATTKAQLVFVPFVALVDNVLSEGHKYACRVVKFSDVGKTITIETAAATADVIVFSYEHAQRAVRIIHELLARSRLGKLGRAQLVLRLHLRYVNMCYVVHNHPMCYEVVNHPCRLVLLE
jgi:hypothetical protein